MSYDVQRIFVNDNLPEAKDIYFAFGSNCVPTSPNPHYDVAYLSADVIILTVRGYEVNTRTGRDKIYNILFWQTEEGWDMSLFSSVPSIFRFRTGAFPIRFQQVITNHAIRTAALKLYQELNLRDEKHSGTLTPEEIASLFWGDEDEE